MDNEHWAADLPGKDKIDNEENALDLFSSLDEEAVEEPAQEETPEAADDPILEPTQRIQQGGSTPVYTPPVREPETQPRPEPAPQPVAPEPDEEEKPAVRKSDGIDYNKKLKRLIRNLSIIALSTMVVVFLIVLAVFSRLRSAQKSNKQQASSNSSAVPKEAEDIYEGAEVIGVIEQIDARSGKVTVYSDLTESETVFDLSRAESITDQYGTEISASNLHRGQVVDVKFNAVNGKIELLRLTAQVSQLTNAYGAIINDNVLTVSGAAYSIDDHLVCLYQGEDFDIRNLTAQQVFTAMILDSHIYTIYVTYNTGQLKLNNIGGYVGGLLTVTSATGAKSVSQEVTSIMGPVDVLEGLNTVTITKNGLTIYTAKVFIVGGEIRTLNLPASSERTGAVKLVAEPESATITIDGYTYVAGETIELAYGEHQLTATAYGYTDYEKTITVGQPYQRVLIQMVNSTTSVSITSAVSGSAVYINGSYQGVAPLRVSLYPGTYRITLITPGYYDVTMNVTVTGGTLEQVVYFSEFYREKEESSEEESSSESSESSSESSESSSESSESSSEEESSSESSEESSESSQESSESSESSSESSEESSESSESSSESSEESSESSESSEESSSEDTGE